MALLALKHKQRCDTDKGEGHRCESENPHAATMIAGS
jgi:hypothetical protein